jgi:hypothetical protein
MGKKWNVEEENPNYSLKYNKSPDNPLNYILVHLILHPNYVKYASS